MPRQFAQVDVFTEVPYRGNPVAVVLGADGLGDEEMQRFAHWTNLSETTFVLPPRDPGADYRVRIFTTGRELPFAGHPTLGTCHAWLEAGGTPRRAGEIVQECGAGLVTVRQTEAGLAFAAPPLLRAGPVDEPLARRIADVLRISRDDIVDLQWADNGPGWVAVLLARRRGGPRHRRGGTLPARIAGGAGGPRAVLHGRRHLGRGPGDRQPERLARAVAARHRAGQRAVRGEPGHRARPPGPRARLP
jgi:hypothetical protein